MSTLMENAEEINVIPEKGTFLFCAEQPDFPQIKVEQQVDEVTMNKTIAKLGTITYNSMIETDINNIDINMDHKELKKEVFQIDQNKIIRHEETSASIKNDITHEEENSIATAKKITSKINRRISARKNKKSNQLSESKKENLKKVNPGKVIKQKVQTKKSYKTSLKLDTNKILKQEDKKPLENYTKVELYKINTEGCSRCNLPSFTSVKSETKMYDTKVLCPSVARQQKLNQNNTNVLQLLDYNNLKYTHQQTMSAANSWMTVPKSNENFALNNNINNMQTEEGQNGYVNNIQRHACSVTADYNWKQHENPYFNSLINSTDPYKLLPENKTYCPCSIYNPNCTWNNTCMQSFSGTNATFQQATNNVPPNYAVLPVNTSNNFLRPTATSFNPFYYYQQLLTDDNFKKLYYTNLNNNGCELTIKKENTTPLFDNWHHSNSLMMSSNSSLNMPPATSTWYNAQSSNSLDAINSDMDKLQFKCEQNSYLTNHYNEVDMTKTNMYKDQWRNKDQFVSYVKPILQNTLPTVTAILKAPIDMHALEPCKADNGLIYHNSTASSADNSMMCNIAEIPSETTAADVHEELNVPCMYTKDKKLISEVLESIL